MEKQVSAPAGNAARTLCYLLYERKVRIHSAPSLLVELGSDVAARGEPPRFTPSCHKATMLHAASFGRRSVLDSGSN